MLSSDDFRISGPRRLVLNTSLEIALCKLKVALYPEQDALHRRVLLAEVVAEAHGLMAPGAGA